MKIAIVEGNKHDREIISRIIGQLGKECELVGVAADAGTGYEIIRDKCPDLIIMDIYLAKESGLSMLKKIRNDRNMAKVLILTADMDIDRIRQAIGLGVDDYLLKPIKARELGKSVLRLVEKWKDEKSVGESFNLDNVLMSWLGGQIGSDDDLMRIAEGRYGFTLDDAGTMLAVWLGQNYILEKENAKKLLKAAGDAGGFSVSILDVAVRRMILVVIYGTGDTQIQYKFYREKVIPVLHRKLRGDVVCLWDDLDHMAELSSAVRRIREMLQWNLVFDRKELIRAADIEKLDLPALKYPVELEEQMKKAVSLENVDEIRKCYYALYDYFRREIYRPWDIKECLVRFTLNAVNTYKVQHVIESEVEIQNCMYEIAQAVCWSEIRTILDRLLRILKFHTFGDDNDGELSSLVKNAVELVRKYYDQGITLEETADRLYVSEEYLSSQFKKETGYGFTETVRRYRMERIRYLLLNTRLKLHQIAELAGYADPKYMSRVFKEETGMSPNEFRKSAH